MSRIKWLTLLGALLFVIGQVIGLALSGTVVWAELEARFRSSYSGDQKMPLECPLMLAPFESATIEGLLINHTMDEIKPVIRSELSRAGGAQEVSEAFPLTAREIRPMQWTVSSANIIFDRLILVNVLQSHYRDNPSRWGSCGIVAYSLWGLPGGMSFGLLFGLALLGLSLGGGLWVSSLRPLSKPLLNIARAGAFLASMTVAALVTTLMRLWGLSLFFDAFSLLIIGTVFIDFILFPQHNK